MLKHSAIVLFCFALGFGGGAVLRRAGSFSEVPARPIEVPSAGEITAEVPAPWAKLPPVDPTKPSVERRVRDLVQGAEPKSYESVFDDWSVAELAQAAEVMLKCRRLGEAEADYLIRAGPQLVEEWARRDLAAALAWVKRYPYWREGQTWEASIYGVLAETDPVAAFKAIADHPNKAAAREMEINCLVKWTKCQPIEAMNWFLTHPDLHWNPGAAHGAAGAWNDDWKKRWDHVQQQPEGPARWLLEQSLFQLGRKDSNIEVLFTGLEAAKRGRLAMYPDFDSLDNPEVAARLWAEATEELPPSYQDAAAAEALRVLSYKDENAILSFLSTPLTEVQENRLLVHLGRRLAALRATWVQRLFLEKIPSDSVRNRIVAQAADYNSGAISDPFAPPGANVETSLQLLALQGDVGLKRSSLMRLGSAWSRSDKAKAAQWLQNQPLSLERDWAANGFMAQIARDNPTEAQNWLRLIQSREAKTAAIKNIALHWLKKSSGNAQAWLNVQRLSPEDLADIHDAVRHASVDGAFKPDGGWTVYP